MSAIPTGLILEAVNRGEASLPELKRATGLDYPVLLQALEGDLSMAVRREETVDGFLRFRPLGYQPERKIASIPVGPLCIKCRVECKKTHQAGNTVTNGGEVRWMCPKCKVKFPGTHAKGGKVGRISDFSAADRRLNEIIAAGQMCGCGKKAGHKGICGKRDPGVEVPEAPEDEVKLCAECGQKPSDGGKLCWDCDSKRIEAGLAAIEAAPILTPEEQDLVVGAIPLQALPEESPMGDAERPFIPILTPAAPTVDEARSAQQAGAEYALENLGTFPPSVVLKRIVWDDDFFMVSYDTLLAILDDDMTAEEKDAVWLLLRYLKRIEKDDLEQKFMGAVLAKDEALRTVNGG